MFMKNHHFCSFVSIFLGRDRNSKDFIPIGAAACKMIIAILFNNFLVVLAFLSLTLYVYTTRHFNHWKKKKIFHLKPLPFVGNFPNAYLLRKSIPEELYSVYKRADEKVIGLFLGDEPCLLIRDPELIRNVLINDFHYFTDRSIMRNENDRIGSRLLFLSKHLIWQKVRARMHYILSSEQIEKMFNNMQSAGTDMTHELLKAIRNNNLLDMNKYLRKSAVGLISENMFGLNCFADKNTYELFIKNLDSTHNLLQTFRWNFHYTFPGLVKLVNLHLFEPKYVDFIKNEFWKVINESRLDCIPNSWTDFGDGLDSDNATARLVEFFFHGLDTVNATLNFTLYELAKNAIIQEKLRTEIFTVIRKYSEINYTIIKEMHYLDCVIKEVLRKYPAVPFLERKCKFNYKMRSFDLTIDMDTPVFISVCGLHYDPKYFLDPEKFIPERFQIDDREKFFGIYLPFGDGKRNCIGQEFAVLAIKILLVSIIKTFRIEFQDFQPEIIDFTWNFFLSPKKQFNLNLKKI